MEKIKKSIYFNLKELVKPCFAEWQTEVDITAVLKYIQDKWCDYQNWIYKTTIRICSIDNRDWEIMVDYWEIPNKPLHLYNETEEKDLLDLLLKLK